ncbi:MAG: DUF6398 domain-containing protein [Cyanobium sp.]
MARALPRPHGFGAGADVWEIGLEPMPAFVVEGGTRIQPLIALVMEAGGALRASEVGHRDQPLEALQAAIATASERPQPPCEPGLPRRVVVNSARLRKLVQPLLPGVAVQQGATPQVVEAAACLKEHLAGGAAPQGMDGLRTYLTADITPEVVAAFFEAAAELYERRPWERLPSDGHLFEVSCSALGILDWAGCAIGRNRESYGVILFDSVQAYGRYVERAECFELGDEDAMLEAPPHRAINFEARSAMPRPLLEEIRRHRWPVAAGDGFPTVMLIEPGMLLAPPCRADLHQLEAVARALVQWLDAEPELAAQWQQPRARRRRFQVSVAGTTVPVTLAVVPHLDSQAAAMPGTAPSPPVTVPAALRDKVDSLLARIDPFCAEHLDSDYRRLIHVALGALSRKRPSPLLSGREPSWAAGVVHAIGSANFLFDASQSPHCTAAEIQEHFGVSASTAQAHSKKVRELLNIHPFSPHWTLPSLLERSAIPWMLEVDGFIRDVRTLPLEVQIAACARGLIPYVPALK